MLVLTRKSNESVIIDDKIEVKVLGVKGDHVSLGFAAPREISIYRREVHEAIQKEKLEAAEVKAVAKESEKTPEPRKPRAKRTTKKPKA